MQKVYSEISKEEKKRLIDNFNSVISKNDAKWGSSNYYMPNKERYNIGSNRKPLPEDEELIGATRPNVLTNIHPPEIIT